jgi:hypothetical protein
MKTQQSFWATAEKAIHSPGCWSLNTHQMGPYTSTYTVSQPLYCVDYNVQANHCILHGLLILFQLFFPIDGEAAQLSWLRRMKIAIGIAQGLRYLHTELQPPFAISELNSSSVYVTEDFTPKVRHGFTGLFLWTFSVR